MLIALTSFSTEQEPDLLIYGMDTIYISDFPLELLFEKDSVLKERIKDKKCISSSCWRQYVATWKIENDSLFLVDLVDCCDYKRIEFDDFFNSDRIENGKVFAFWYSDKINAGFGNSPEFIETTWEYLYDKQITIEIKNGKITSLEVKKS